MTLRRMIDAAYLPTDPAQLQMVRNLTGASVAVVYIPGWGAPYHATPVSQAKMLSQQGMLLLPLLVPTPDGGDITEAEAAVGIDVAVKYMQEVGTTGTLISVDFESPWFAAKPGPVCDSQVEFVLAARAAGLTFVPYLSPANTIELARRAVRPDAIWVASWINTVPSSVASIPGVPDYEWNRPGQRAWQYKGGHLVAGDDIDSSLSNLEGYWVPTAKPTTPPPTPLPTEVAVPTSTLQEIVQEAQAGQIQTVITTVEELI